MNTNTNTTMKPKTRLCENIKRIGTCVYGKNCHFAHDIKELTVSKCAFGQRCVFVQYSESTICNSQGSKICKFLHPNETVQDLFNRLEISPSSPLVPSPKLTPSAPSAPKKSLQPFVVESDITPIRLNLELPNEWVTVCSKKIPVEVPIPVKKLLQVPQVPQVLVEPREMKLIATVDAKNLLDSVEKWMNNGLTELFITINYN